jgi:threonine dehydrogenase-like Zn-dependent dehydrogenase
VSYVKSRVATIRSPGQVAFEVEELSMNLEANTILCESLVSVISPGTELAAYRGAPPLRMDVTYPRFVGYCNVARVLARGAKVTNVAVGDRVVTLQSHRSHFILSSSEIVSVVPPGICSREAACSYLYQLGYNSVLRGGVRLGSTVVVIGMGALGITSVAMSVLAGGRVFGVSDYEGARERVCRLGGLECFSRRDIELLFAALGEQRAHVIVSTTGDWSDWRIALDAAGDQGAIVVLGFPGRESNDVPLNPLDSRTFYTKQLRVIAAGHSPLLPEPKGFLPFNLRDNMERILGWISAGVLRPKMLLSGEFEGLALQEAYESLLRRENAALTYSLNWEKS